MSEVDNKGKEPNSIGQSTSGRRAFLRKAGAISLVLAAGPVGWFSEDFVESLFPHTSQRSGDKPSPIPTELLIKYHFTELELSSSVVNGSDTPSKNLTPYPEADALGFLSSFDTLKENGFTAAKPFAIDKGTGTIKPIPQQDVLQNGITIVTLPPSQIDFYNILTPSYDPNKTRVYALYVNDDPKAPGMRISYSAQQLIITDSTKQIQSGSTVTIRINNTPNPNSQQSRSISSGKLILAVYQVE